MKNDNINSSNIDTNNSNSEENQISSKKSFWKDKKNIAIVILSFILICFIISYPDSTDVTEYTTKIDELNNQINTLASERDSLNAKIEENQKQITDLQNANKAVEEERQKLVTEKQELSSKVEELEKTSSQKSTEANKVSSTNSSSSSNNTTSANSNTTANNSSSSNNSSTNSSSSSKVSTPANTNPQEEMVWVGETGTKYHYQNCRTLKGKGHQITLKQALAEGREPCKVCH